MANNPNDFMTPQVQYVPAPPRKRSPLRRLGCGVALVFWFLVLLTPLFLFTMAQQGEIVITTGSAPDQQIRLWLIMEIDQRGFGISTASVQQSEPNALCVQTNVNYLLWAGRERPSVHCSCYQRADESAAWSYTDSRTEACS